MVVGSVLSSGTKSGYHKVVIVSLGAIELRVRLGSRMLRIHTSVNAGTTVKKSTGRVAQPFTTNIGASETAVL